MSGEDSSGLDLTLVGINYGPEPTGIAPYTQGMAEGLLRAGHRVRVITSYPSYPAWEVASEYSGVTQREIINGVQVTRLRTAVPSSPTPIRRVGMEAIFGVRAATEIPRTTDAVVCVSPAFFSSAVVAAKTLTQPAAKRPAFGVWVQDIYGLGLVETGTADGFSASLVSRMELSLLRKADNVAVIHERFANYVKSAGVDASRVRVIPNWAHISRADDNSVKSTRAKYGWSDSESVILHAGNMGAKQGLESVIDTARLAADQRLPIKFVFVGDGNRREALEAYAEEGSVVQFIDPVPESEFPRLLAAADILLLNELPSVAEMCVPSKLTSYFAAGRPVLAATTQGGVSASVIHEAGAGLVVSPGDPHALMQGAQHLIGNKQLSESFAMHGRRYSEERLAPTGAIADFEDWLENLVGRSRRRRRS